MLVLLPHRSPDRHIVKATIGNPGHRFVRFVRAECRADRLDCLLDFRWLTHKSWSLTTKETVIQDSSSSRGNPQHIERSISWNEAFPIQGWNLHQIRQFTCIRFAQI